MKKKALALALAACMAASLAACSGSGSETTAAATEAETTAAETSGEETTAGEETEAEETTEAAAETEAAGGTLVMATNAEFEPWEYKEGDEVVGIDADIAQAICDKLGYELKIEDMAFEAILTSVDTGKADFGAAGMTVTPEREESVDFTDTYAEATQVVIVKK